MAKIISFVKDGKRTDFSQGELKKVLEKGGPGSSGTVGPGTRGGKGEESSELSNAKVDHIKQKILYENSGMISGEKESKFAKDALDKHLHGEGYKVTYSGKSEDGSRTVEETRYKHLQNNHGVIGELSHVDGKDYVFSWVKQQQLGKGGPGSGRFSDEVSEHQVKLQAAKHLRRQGILGRKKVMDSGDIEKGGPGSGNFGHSGRPGERGGSGEGGGNKSEKETDLKEIASFTSDFKNNFGDALELKEYKTNKFQEHLGYGAESIFTNSHYINVNAKSDIAPAYSIRKEGDKPLPGEFHGMLWLSTEVNPNGITGPKDKGRTYTIDYELKGDKKVTQRTWESNATILKFHCYGRTPEEAYDKFGKWVNGPREDFKNKYGIK
jgi:hypothetical protein